MRINHSPDSLDPGGRRQRGGRWLRRPAIQVLAVAGAGVALTVVLAFVVSAIVSSAGNRPLASGPRALRRSDPPAAAGDPANRAARPAGVRVTGRPVRVTIATRPTGGAVPSDFVGLSFEMRSLPAIATYADRGNLVALLRSVGPGVMRFGGASADEQVAWVEAGATRPAWASTAITAADLAGIATLARETGWRVMLTVNLGHYDPTAAAQEAAAAHALVGSALEAVAIGNEPDLYVRKHMRARGWDVAAYLAQAQAYRAAIEAAVPGLPIAGPDPSTGLPGLAWLRAAVRTLQPQVLTDHYYPLSSCGEAPTLGELLSPNVRRSESGVLRAAVAIARDQAHPLRVDETNDISCEGEPGVSDTFAAALWALDYSARAAAAGAAGVNFHDLIAKADAYSPLIAHGPGALAAGTLHAAPEWYALLAAHAFIGAQGPPATHADAGERPLPTTVAGAAPGELSAGAARAPNGGVRLVLIDYDAPGSPPLAVRLRAPANLAGGSVLRLTAPSPAATAGVRLGGRAVAADGTWAAPPALPRVSGRAGALAVQMPADSAAVVTLTPAQAVGRAALPD